MNKWDEWSIKGAYKVYKLQWYTPHILMPHGEKMFVSEEIAQKYLNRVLDMAADIGFDYKKIKFEITEIEVLSEQNAEDHVRRSTSED